MMLVSYRLVYLQTYLQVQISLLCGRLWLRGRASILLSESRWFDSPGLHVQVSLGKILKPKLLLVCCSEPFMAACISA